LSIFVSICCLGIDHDLPNTISSCFDMANNPEEVYIGIACIGEESFYKEISQLFNNKNITISYHESTGNIGVGKGRKLAADLYDNQDYFLQIDSHTLFRKDWDIKILDKYIEALKKFNTDRVVFSGYLSGYKYIEQDGNIYQFNDTQDIAYNYWHKDEFFMNPNIIPKWTHASMNHFSDDIIKESETGFLPCKKITAMFLFGSKKLAKNLCLPEHLVFWEEEIIQTIELIDNNFILVHPVMESPISHLYFQGTLRQYGFRTSLKMYLRKNNK